MLDITGISDVLLPFLSACLYHIFRFSKTCAVLSHFSRVQLFATPWIVAHQVSLSMGFSREECWIRLPFPSPGDLPDPGTEGMSPALAGSFFTTSANREAASYSDFLFCVSPSLSLDLHFSHLDGLFSRSSVLSLSIQHCYH